MVRSDIRHLLRTGGGTVGDFAIYLPLPGSSQRFAAFLGPSVTLADRRYFRDLFGVTGTQSIASGHPMYDGASWKTRPSGGGCVTAEEQSRQLQSDTGT